MPGIAGGGALLACAVLIADNRFTGWLAYCGRHSLPIYLAFVLPMGATRTVLVDGVGLMSGAIISLAVMAGAVGGPLLFEFLVRNTWAGFLFRDPDGLE